MSAIAGWFGTRLESRGPAPAAGLLRLMPRLDDDRIDTWYEDGVSVGVSRCGWQLGRDLEGEVLVARSERTVVASDANLYATAALADALAGTEGQVRSRDVAELILQAYEAWGDDCARHLNGDYAFVVWDRRERRALLCRDVTGRRSLFLRRLPDGLAVASRAGALAQAFEPLSQVNLPLVAAAASALPGGSTTSPYEGIDMVPAGATVAWTPSRGTEVVALWKPPPFQVHSCVMMHDAAQELRECLTTAVLDRIAGGPAAVWLSGGADSTAIFATAMAASAPDASPGAVQAVSVTYPPGDPAREDEHILALTGHWNTPVSWIDSEQITLFDGMEKRAAIRDDPFAHTFGQVNRALSETTRVNGARVALDGYGGDALFEVSNAYLADLLLAGDVPGWWRARKASGLTGWRSTLRQGVLPALPEWCWSAVDLLRARPLARPFQYPLVTWLSKGARKDLLALGWDRVDLRPHPREGPAAFEARCGLSGPHFARALSSTRDHTVTSGVEVRSPFMDRRVIELAASRPVAERGWQGNGKRLLKLAMKGIIPDSVLAPRRYKTGVAGGYLHRQFRTSLLARLSAAFGTSSALGDHRLVEPAAVMRSGEAYQAQPDHLTGVTLYLTLEAELWLRSRSSRGVSFG